MAEVVIQLDPPLLRLAVLRPGGVRAEEPFDPGAVRGGLVEDQGAVREALRGALRQVELRGVRPRRAWWVLPLEAAAEHLAVFPPLARQDRAPAVERLLGEWLGPDAPPVVARWRPVVSTPDELRVYVSAVRADVVSALEGLGSSAGLKQAGCLSLTWALCAAARDGFVVHASLSGQVLAVLARAGRPVWLAREEFFAGWDPAPALAQLASSCRAEGGAFDRVLLSGAADNDEVAACLEGAGLGAVPLASWPWGVLAAAPSRQRVDYGSGGSGRGRRRAALVAMVLVLACEVAGLGAGWARVDGALARAQAQVAAQAAEVARVQRQAEQVKQLKAQVEQVKEAVAPRQSRPDWRALYGQLSARAGRVALSNLEATRVEDGPGWLVLVRGTAPALGDVLSFARRLEEGPFSRPYLEQVAVSPEGDTSFSLKVRWSP